MSDDAADRTPADADARVPVGDRTPDDTGARVPVGGRTPDDTGDRMTNDAADSTPDHTGDRTTDDAADSTLGDAPDSTSAGAHDAAWFEALVRAHATAVHRFVVRRAGREDAEDLAADVLTVAWRRRADVPDGAELPWLYRTAGFVVANHRRKGRPVPVADVPEGVDSDDPAVRAIEEERVREVLGALSPRDREILLLNAWEGMAGDALAQVLGIGRGGADAALSRARARLRDAWASAES